MRAGPRGGWLRVPTLLCPEPPTGGSNRTATKRNRGSEEFSRRAQKRRFVQPRLGGKQMRHVFQQRRLSPAMIVACIALTVALGETSYAAVSRLVPRDSVGTSQLRNDAVTSKKVRDFSLRAWDFRRNALPRGPQGLPGAQGPPGVIGDLTLREQSVSVPGNTVNDRQFATRATQIRCRSDEKAITGGTRWSSDENQEDMITVYSRPFLENGKPVGWRGRGGTDVSTDRVFTVMVLCAKA